MPSRFCVLHPIYDYVLWKASAEETERLVNEGLATKCGGRVRLNATGIPHPCRTHTGRGGLLGAVGRGQHYTIEKSNGFVLDFEAIYPEDAAIFQSAAASAGATMTWRGPDGKSLTCGGSGGAGRWR